jgi:hypothetical protein
MNLAGHEDAAYPTDGIFLARNQKQLRVTAVHADIDVSPVSP